MTSSHRYEITTEDLPIRIWSSEEPEENVLRQARNLANHSLARRWVGLMPDYHLGYGMPIGGVLATQGGVVPNAVGVDIGCFTGDTRVVLCNGERPTLEELAGRSEPFAVWAHRGDEVTAAYATCSLTRRNAKLAEVTLDNSERIRCTPDHQFLRRDGTFSEAARLVPGDSLMPLYLSEGRGHDVIRQPDGRRERAHHIVARAGLVKDEREGAGGFSVIHHRNGNVHDNGPDNLVRITQGEHLRRHHKEWRKSPVLVDKRKATARANLLAIDVENTRGNGPRGRQFLVAYNRSEKGRERSREVSGRAHRCPFCPSEMKSYVAMSSHLRYRHRHYGEFKHLLEANHKVVAVRALEERADVYCLTVPGPATFALAAGVFVHNCGMIAIRLTTEAAGVSREQLETIRQEIHSLVPVGNGPGGSHAGDGDLELSEELEWSRPAYVDVEVARRQAGTLGGGNHFIELQRGDDGYLWLMLHSGSRATGKKTCDRFHAVARRYSDDIVPDKDLSYIPDGVPEYDEYLNGMNWCMRYAEYNRGQMLTRSLDALAGVLGHVEVKQQLETHHNFAALEEHFGETYLVHRKGAVRAEGLVTIPGSMGTCSYIGRGLEPTESFNTCSHGAGRLLGRRQANRQIKHEEAVAAMAHVVFGVRDGDYDETPACYKDIEQVMRDQAALVEPVVRLEPLAVVKG